MRRHIIIASIVAGAVLVGPLLVLADWIVAPTNPPSGNASAPLNVSSINQDKIGGLEVGALLSDGGAVIMGNLGVGVISPGYKLDVGGTVNAGQYCLSGGNCITAWPSGGGGGSSQWANGAGGAIYYDGGNVGIGTAIPGAKLDVSGNVNATGFYYSSDRTLKDNIAALSGLGSLADIMKLQGVSFDWKKDGAPGIGLIAQDVEKVYPELVNTDPKTGLKSVEYGNLVAPLIEAIKAQQKEISALNARIEALEAR